MRDIDIVQYSYAIA